MQLEFTEMLSYRAREADKVTSFDCVERSARLSRLVAQYVPPELVQECMPCRLEEIQDQAFSS